MDKANQLGTESASSRNHLPNLSASDGEFAIFDVAERQSVRLVVVVVVVVSGETAMCDDHAAQTPNRIVSDK